MVSPNVSHTVMTGPANWVFSRVDMRRVCTGLCLVVERFVPLYLAGLKIQQGDLAGYSDR